MQDLRYVETADSTRNVLKETFNADGMEVQAVYTFRQTAGVGQEGNEWFCGEGDNVALSVGFRTDFLKSLQEPAEVLFCLNMALSLGALDYMRQQVRRVWIKWPNDLYYEDRKLGGVLIENRMQKNDIASFFFGIGWNVNQTEFPADLPNPVSFFQLNGRKLDLHEQAADMFLALKNAYWDFKKIYTTRGLAWTRMFYRATYMQNLYHYGRWRHYNYNGESIWARIVDVNPCGYLVLEKQGGAKIAADIKQLEYEPA